MLHKSNDMVGAQYHIASDCTTAHIICPVLFAVFNLELPKMKRFLKENMEVSIWEEGINAYKEWLVQVPGRDVPNHIKLYWWILTFWGRLD
jgi:hypothetical protein